MRSSSSSSNSSDEQQQASTTTEAVHRRVLRSEAAALPCIDTLNRMASSHPSKLDGLGYWAKTIICTTDFDHWRDMPESVGTVMGSKEYNEIVDIVRAHEEEQQQ